jgi:ABC-type multidrug transport system fused ATPase/permease subunit
VYDCQQSVVLFVGGSSAAAVHMIDVIHTIRRAIALVSKGTRRRLIIIAIISVLVSAMDLLAIILLVPFLTFLGPGGVQDSWIVNTTADLLGTTNEERIALVLALVATLLFVAKGITAVCLLWIQNGVLNRAQAQLANRILRSFVRAPWLVQQDSTTGALIRTTIGSVQYTVNVLGSAVVMIAEGSVFVAVMIALIVISPALAISALIYLALAGITYVALVRRPIERRGAQLQAETERMNSSVIELVGGIKELTIRGSADTYLDRYGSAIAKFLEAFRLITVTNQAMRYLLEILMIAGAAFVIGFATFTGSTTVLVSIGVLLAGGFRMIPALNMLLFSINTIRSYESGVAVVEDELARLGDDDVAMIATAPSGVGSSTGSFVPTGSFAVRGVRFSYPTRTEDAVSAIDLDVRFGEAIGIVGASGSGKSTLVDLLLGLLHPDEGSIEIDGRPLAENLNAWRDQIGFVPQDIFLLDDTLASNIALARTGESASLDRLREAIRLAHLESVVESLPEGLETVLGERGVRMSGGQKQRIGLARALYGSPSVLILDEATSALDNQTERLISDALNSLHGQLTMIVIAHRLSTVRSCDRIVYMEEGRIAGVGTFDELDRTNEGFAKLVELGSLRGAF